MENVVPPFKVDVAGAFLMPKVLIEAREQLRNGQLSQVALRAMEDAEIRTLVDRLKAIGSKVVTDGRFRSDSWPLDFMCGFEGVRLRPTKKSTLELTGRIDLHHHFIIDDFMFLTGITGGDIIAKQVLPAPSLMLAELLKEDNREELDRIYPDLEVLLEDIAIAYHKLITELYGSGCRYVQFDDITHIVTDNAIRVNNMSLVDYPKDLFVAFHASSEMLYAVKGMDAFFLDYDSASCGKSRLLWFIREKQATFGFVLSHYPDEEELDELCAKIEEVNRYIPLRRFTLCIPNPQPSSFESYETTLQKQWDTLSMAEIVVKRFSPEEG
ncbi:MAG: methionine synthase [Bacteroides sp.]|nr:methionine synthase [Bacteroides sp.]